MLKRRKPLARKAKKKPTADEYAYLSRIAALGCIICQSPACIHHIRHGQGMGQRASHYETIPLCHTHHQGKEGIHTLGTKAWQKKYGSELDLLKQTIQRLGRSH